MAENRINRELETREKNVRKRAWQRPEVLPSPNPEPGYTYRWIRTSNQGLVDATNVSSKLREGWEPVKASDHPEISLVTIENEDGKPLINRLHYEMAIFEVLISKLIVKDVWVEGAYRYRDPDSDVPADFYENKETYFKELGLPLNPDDFIKPLQEKMTQKLQYLNDDLPFNTKIKILKRKNKSHIKVSPSEPQEEPTQEETYSEPETQPEPEQPVQEETSTETIQEETSTETIQEEPQPENTDQSSNNDDENNNR